MAVDHSPVAVPHDGSVGRGVRCVPACGDGFGCSFGRIPSAFFSAHLASSA
jgi:hypothetical protein